ncbi:MAG: 4-hydroxy-3-methylbut-2-enyl diphosphate reductase [Spirochaetaceae bacterium]|nr:4-hydroxy-3-methylbut-2-enyl diphosphate reductase [Spirochaetaceae bacterium]
MTIIKARMLGMCMGVSRAQELAVAAANTGRTKGKNVFSYGPLIHNPQAIAKLEAKGVGILDVKAFEAGNLDEAVMNSIVVIRAHGAPPAVFERLATLGAEVVDATCPRVLRSQKKASELAGAGYRLIIAGDSEHAEVAGILGHVPDAIVVQNAAEAREAAKALATQEGLKLVVIAQTTIQKAEYSAIIEEISQCADECVVLDTLCPAATERQAALVELARNVSAIIVVGGKNSANTQRLFLTAQETGKPCWHIETAAELPAEVFSFDRIGLTAGASTPDFMVDEVENFLRKGVSDGNAL